MYILIIYYMFEVFSKRARSSVSNMRLSSLALIYIRKYQYEFLIIIFGKQKMNDTDNFGLNFRHLFL